MCSNTNPLPNLVVAIHTIGIKGKQKSLKVTNQVYPINLEDIVRAYISRGYRCNGDLYNVMHIMKVDCAVMSRGFLLIMMIVALLAFRCMCWCIRNTNFEEMYKWYHNTATGNVFHSCIPLAIQRGLDVDKN